MTEPLPRPWISLRASCDELSVKVAQWNVLNSTLCDQKSFPYADISCLNWTDRIPLILRELERVDADIIALEEVDQVEFYQTVLEAKGYASKIAWKLNEVDAACLFFRKDKFVAVASETVPLREGSSQVGLLVILRPAESDDRLEGEPLADYVQRIRNCLCVVVTHLKAKPAFEDDRIIQVQNLLESLRTFNSSQIPVIICGDLNSEPGGRVYPLFIQSELRSAYGEYDGGSEPEFTTYKRRDHVSCHTIDYIFYSRGLDLIGLWKLPTLSEMEFLPCPRYPSDHLTLMAEFTWTN